MNEIWTILIGAAPIAEVRGAIPIAVAAFGFSPFKAFLLGTLGNVLVITPLLAGLHFASAYLSHRVYFINRFLNWLFSYTKARHANHFAKYFHTEKPLDFQSPEQNRKDWLMTLALFVFVAIPLPLTGGWSGVLAAFVFGIPFWRAVLAISLGTVTAGLIVLAAVLGVIQVGVFVGG